MPNTTVRSPLKAPVELHPLLGPEPLERAVSSATRARTTILTTEELARAGSVATPPAPSADRFGYRVSHITGRYVLGGTSDAYCIWRFQSAAPPMEFPMTPDGWAHAWTTFRALEDDPKEPGS
jgi:hypothetical protein